jgi:hypothetical protein
MGITERYCVNHPQRPAIGVCVMTHKAICGECSTRYEGVNYSKEGLLLLQQQRAAAAAAASARGRGWGKRLGGAMLTCVWMPALLYLVYLAYLASAQTLTTMLQRGP